MRRRAACHITREAAFQTVAEIFGNMACCLGRSAKALPRQLRGMFHNLFQPAGQAGNNARISRWRRCRPDCAAHGLARHARCRSNDGKGQSARRGYGMHKASQAASPFQWG